MKKIIDNFNLLADELFFRAAAMPRLEGDEFYFVQVLKRGKDGNDVCGRNHNRLIGSYAVLTYARLEELKPEIVALCRLHNARAYIHPVPRSYKSVAAAMLVDAAREFTGGNYHLFRQLFSSACGQSYVSSKKKFIVDLDGEAANHASRIESILYYCRGEGGDKHNKLWLKVPTKNGCHLVTLPFDVGQFEADWKRDNVLSAFPFPDVHKNNPTLLYFEYEEGAEP